MSDFKSKFPVFRKHSELVYLDTAASAQKLGVVVDKVRDFSINSYANVHRGLYELAERSTLAYENARKEVAEFIGASFEEIVFVRNATEAINLVAWSWGWRNLSKGDVVVLSVAEHHANMVPWIELQKTVGFEIVWIDLDKDGFVDEKEVVETLVSRGSDVKMVSLFGVSNVLGQRIDLEMISQKCQEVGCKFLVDACQLVVHEEVDVKELGCDFLVFSGHKLYGPSGIGVMFAKKELMEDIGKFPAFMSGGDMIENVSLDIVTFKSNYERFEAGTPAIEAAVGLGEACKFLMSIDRGFETELMEYLERELLKLEFVDVIGPQKSGVRSGLVSFNVKGVHAHDVAHILGEKGIAVRAGQHCAHPLHEKLGIMASVRASIGIYNSKEDVDKLIEGLREVVKVFN